MDEALVVGAIVNVLRSGCWEGVGWRRGRLQPIMNVWGMILQDAEL